MNTFTKKLVVCLLLLIVGTSFAQTSSDYMVVLKNGSFVSSTRYEFDIYLVNTGSTDFPLYLLQVGLLFKDGVRNGGTLSCGFMAGTSEVPSSWQPKAPNIATNVTSVTPNMRHIKIGGNFLAGSSTPIAVSPTGVRWGRFFISNSTSFGGDTSQILFNFGTTLGTTTTLLATKVNALVSGVGTDITNASRFSYSVNVPLPVELSAFSSLVKQRDVTLDWKTATELNFSRFEIERAAKKDNVELNWAKVAEVKAAGNSNSTISYSYTDKKLQSGKYEYRLKMVDNDGTSKYSKVLDAEVELPKSYKMSQNYPNPFNPSTRVDYELPRDGMVTMELYSISGEKVATILNEQQEAGYHTVSISAANTGRTLASGMYIYRLIASGLNNEKFVSVKKMILMK